MANGKQPQLEFKWQRPADWIYRAGAGMYFPTIQDAINAANADIVAALTPGPGYNPLARATVELYDSDYNENLTLYPKVSLKAVAVNCRIAGTHTYAGYTSLSGTDLELQISGIDFFSTATGNDLFHFTGLGPTEVRFLNCQIYHGVDDGTSVFKFSGASTKKIAIDDSSVSIGSDDGNIFYAVPGSGVPQVIVTNSRGIDGGINSCWIQQATGSSVQAGRLTKGTINIRFDGINYQGSGFPSVFEPDFGNIRLIGGYIRSFGATQLCFMNGGVVEVYGTTFETNYENGFLATNNGTQGTDTITIAVNPLPGDTVTFRFNSTPYGGPGYVTYGTLTFGVDVTIGAGVNDTATNLKNAINALTNTLYLTAATGGAPNDVVVTSTLRGASLSNYEIVSSSQGAGRVLVATPALTGGSGGGGQLYYSTIGGPAPNKVQYGITVSQKLKTVTQV